MEEEAPAAALKDLPPGEDVVVAGEAGEEDVDAADSGGQIRIGAAADGHEGGHFVAIRDDEETEERGRVQRAEAAAEGGGGSDDGEEGPAGEGGAD